MLCSVEYFEVQQLFRKCLLQPPKASKNATRNICNIFGEVVLQIQGRLTKLLCFFGSL